MPRGRPLPDADGATHAVAIPVTASAVPDLAEHLSRALTTPVWLAECAGTRDSAVGERAVTAEAARPLALGRSFRVVVVRYDDGQADLVVVADRAALDGPHLLRFARSCAAGVPDSCQPAIATVNADRAIPVPVPGEAVQPFPLSPDISGGADLVVRQRWTETSDTTTAHLVAAVAIVLGYLGRCANPAVAAVASSAEGGAATDRTFLLAPDVSADRTVASLREAVAGILADPACEADAPGGLDRLEGRVGVGVYEVLRLEAGERAFPAVSAPFPLTLCPIVDAQGLEIMALARAEDTDEVQLNVVLGTLRRVHQQVVEGAGTLSSITLVPDQPAPVGLSGPPQDEAARLDIAFACVAARSPGAVAVTDGDRSVCYAELDDDATRIASGLKALGVCPGDRVGICLERSTDLIATMIGVLRASAVYVPMDPDYPDDRLQYTSQDASLRLVITTRDAFPGIGQGTVVTPDELRRRPSGGPAAASGSADDAAYVIYTSGSTGRPKGVVVAHRSVQALIDATRADFGLCPDDTWTLFHSSAFDFSVWEIWGPLLTGARLVVVPYRATRDPEEFRDILRREHVTVLNQTPSAFRQLDEADARCDDRLSIRLVILGGEPLDTHRLAGWLNRYPQRACRLVNMFGITETTVHVTARTISRADVLGASRSVGRAIPGWFVTVRDAQLRPLPPGFPGEILVGGRGLALEYLGRPELTAERFVNDTWTRQRLYRSGDLGRLRTDGELDHLGRIDSQVKIRGFRIELGEIKAVLEGVPGVVAAAVVVGGGTQDRARARLDAFVVLDGTDLRSVRSYAERFLPVHMVPATITAVMSLPITPNGKLDTRALPDPLGAVIANNRPSGSARAPGAVREAASEAPGLAERLRQLWQNLLGVPVAEHDNFFELGGNSLLAVRLATAMREAQLPALPLRLLYLNATPAALATALMEVPVG